MSARSLLFLTRRCLAAGALTLAVTTPFDAPALAQVKAAKDVRIVFVTHGQANDNYWTVVKNGMMAAAKMMNVKVDYQSPTTFDVVKMGQMIDAAAASKPDGLVISIPDAAALEGPVKAAKAAGIPVIVIDSGEDQVKPWGLDLYVGGGSEFDNGVKAGNILGKAGVKKAICVNHEVGNGDLDKRCAGLAEGLKSTGGSVEIVGVTLDPTEAPRRVEAFLKTHPGVDGMMLLGTTLAGPMLSMLDERGYTGKIKTGTFDLAPEVLDGISSDKVLFAIDAQQYMMGYWPVMFLTNKAMFKTFPVNNVYTGPGLVFKQDAASVKTLVDQGIR